MNLSLFFVFLCIGSGFTFDFEPQINNAGLTFVELAKSRISYDSYTILYYLDISQYKNLTLTINEFIDKNKNTCKNIRSKTCETLMSQLTSQLNYMKRDETDIEAYQQKNRKQRAIEVVGSFLHWAFGLMDADTAKDYNNKIDKLDSEIIRIHNVLNEQTSLIKETIDLNNKTVADLQHQLKRINEYVKTYQRTQEFVHFVHSELIFTQGLTVMKLVIMEHQRISQQILHCLEDIVSGKITQLIPKEKLAEDLLQIETLLRENQKLPIDFNVENPLHIFKYSQIATSLYGNRLFLEVTIPIVEREIYTAYKVIPIPTTIQNNTVIINPSTHYVLINDADKEFIPITASEYSKSKFNMRGEKIIKPAENARFDFSENCEISIFMEPNKHTVSHFCDIKIIPTSNYFISINSNDLFYLKINKPILFTEYCQGQTSKFREIHESGLLRLGKDCRVTTDKISLRSRSNYRFESSNIIVLANRTQNIAFECISEKIKGMFNISVPDVEENILIQDYSSDFNILSEKASKIIEKTKQDIKWREVNSRDLFRTKQSLAFSLIVGISVLSLILLILYVLYNKFFKLSTWVKLANILSLGNADDIPHLFIRNTNSNRNLSVMENQSQAPTNI